MKGVRANITTSHSDLRGEPHPIRTKHLLCCRPHSRDFGDERSIAAVDRSLEHGACGTLVDITSRSRHRQRAGSTAPSLYRPRPAADGPSRSLSTPTDGSPGPAGSWLKRPSRRTSCIGNRNWPRDKPPKIAFRPETVSAETETQPQQRANGGLSHHIRTSLHPRSICIGKTGFLGPETTTQNRLQARNEDQHDEIARLPRADLVKAANVSTLFMLPGIMHGILFAVVRVF